MPDNNLPADEGDFSYADWVRAGRPGFSYDDWRWWNTGDTSDRKQEGDTHSPAYMRANGSALDAPDRPNVSPTDPYDIFRNFLAAGKDTSGAAFGLPEYNAAVQREVGRRRMMNLKKNPGLALTDDSTDAILRNTVTGRLGRARGGSTSTALGQAFDPTAPLGRDTLLGD
jgi:hypothetical protein